MTTKAIMGIKKGGLKFACRIVSIICSFAVLNQSVAFAQIEGFSKSAPVMNVANVDYLSNIHNVKLPVKEYNISETYKGNTAKNLIIIQDAHALYAAQKNIAEIISSYINEGKVRAVFLEGASGPIDIEKYAGLKEGKTKDKIFDFYLRKGILSGAEYTAITNPNAKNVKFLGVEDLATYRENLEAFENNFKLRKETSLVISKIEKIAERSISSTLNNKQKEFLVTEKSYRDLKISLTSYISFIYKMLNLFPEIKKAYNADYTVLKSVIHIREIETKINYELLETEKQKFIADVFKCIANEDKKDFLKLCLNLKNTKITAAEFFTKAVTYAKESGISIKDYNTLYLYTQLVKAVDSLEKVKIKDALNVIASELSAKLFSAKEAKSIKEYSDFIYFYKKLISLNLAREEYFSFYEKYSDTDSYIEYVSSVISKNDSEKNKVITLFASLEKIVDVSAEFYKKALDRDTKIAANIYSQMETDKGSNYIVVAGGFHKDALADYCRYKDISFTVINPMIKEHQGTKKYFELLLGEVSLLDYFFANLGTRLSPPLVTGSGSFFTETNRAKSLDGGMPFYALLYIVLEETGSLLRTRKDLLISSVNASKHGDKNHLKKYKEILIDAINTHSTNFFDGFLSGESLPVITDVLFEGTEEKLLVNYSLAYKDHQFTFAVSDNEVDSTDISTDVLISDNVLGKILSVSKDGKVLNSFIDDKKLNNKKSLKLYALLEDKKDNFLRRCRFLQKVSQDTIDLEGVSSPYVFESASLLLTNAKALVDKDYDKALFNISRAEDSLKYAFEKEVRFLKNSKNINLFADSEKFIKIEELINRGDFENVYNEIKKLHNFLVRAEIADEKVSQTKSAVQEKISTSDNIKTGEKKYPFAGKIIAALEALSLSALVASGVLPMSLPVIIGAVLILHFFVAAGVFLNETGHSLVARFVYGYNSAFTGANLTGNLKTSNALKLLIPIVGWLGIDESLYVDITELSDTNIKNRAFKSRVIRVGGFITGAFLTVAVALGFSAVLALVFPLIFTVASLMPLMTAGVSVAVLFASFSDFSKSSPLGTFFCGNVGILSGKGKTYKTVTDIFKKQLDITKVRGEQAGGYAFINPEFFRRSRIVNQKRADLTGSILKSFNHKVGSRNFKESNVILSHLRFATSSASTVEGTHPHVFTPERKKMIFYHINKDGSLLKTRKKFVNFVTHNGDFNGFDFSHEFKFAKELSALNLGEVNAWLKKILYPSTAPGDSVNIAGLMDVLHTKGMPEQSLRLAYYRLIAKDTNDVFDKEISKKFTKILSDCIGTYSNINETPLMVKKFKEAIFADKDFYNIIGADNFEPFVKQVFDNFYNADIASAVKIFSKGSIGSFGMAAASSVVPGKAVLYASGQPLATGISEDGELISWASEPAALKIKDKDGKDVFRYFVYLDDVKGDVLDLGLSREGKITLNAYSAGEEKTYNSIEELFASGKVVDAKTNTLINNLPLEEKDPIKKDKREIPEIMGKITESMETGLNAETGNAFSKLVIDRLKNKAKDDDTADVVFVGEETSAMHAQSASSMLGSVFANLKTATLSGNDVISSSSTYNGKDKTLSVASSKGSPVKIGKDTIVISVSQSGQTFSTYQATNYLTRVSQNVFALTGETDTLMGRAVGQKYYRNAPFTKRIFTNLSGYRHAEASTVASVATGHLLTEIMLKLFKDARAEFKDSSEVFKLKEESIAVLLEQKEKLVNERIPNVLDSKSTVNKNIAKKATKWSQDILESLTVLTLSKAMVFSLVLFGVAPLIPLGVALGLGSVFTIFKGEFVKSIKYLVLGAIVVGLSFITMPFLLQIAIALGFTFLGEIVTTALRLVQQRSDTDRLYGARSIVISDVPYVQKMLESYATKLFGNSHGIASVVIKSGKTNNIPHYFAHQVVRGGKALFNIPGEMLSMRKQRNAVMMNVMQVLGIQNKNAGAEVVTIGHNGEGKATPAHNHLTLNSKALLILLDLEKVIEKISNDAGLSEADNKKLANILSTQLPSLFDTYASAYFIADHIGNMFEVDADKKSILKESIEEFLDEEMDLEKLYENRINAVERYIANIHFFDVLAEKTSKLPWYLFFLKPIVSFKRWTTHNRTRVATTASPQSADDISVKIKILGKPLWEKEEIPAQLPEEELPFAYVSAAAKIKIPSFADIKNVKEKASNTISVSKETHANAMAKIEDLMKNRQAENKEDSLKNIVYSIWETTPAYKQAMENCIADMPEFIKDLDKNYAQGLIPLEGNVSSIEEYISTVFSGLTLKEKAKITEYLLLRKSIEDKIFMHSLKGSAYYKSILSKVILIERTEDKIMKAMLADTSNGAYIDAMVKNILNDDVIRNKFTSAYSKITDSDIFNRKASKKIIYEIFENNEIQQGVIAFTLLKDLVKTDSSSSANIKTNISISSALQTTSILRMAA